MPRRPIVDRFRTLLGRGSDDTLVRESVEPTARQSSVPVPHACGVTDAGRVRAQNEDAFHVGDDGTLLVVADGMGGHRAGEVAAALAVDAVVAAVAGGEDLPRALEAAHAEVQRAASEHPEWTGMGTTLIAARVAGGLLHTCHVGDVRCYVRRGTELRALTHDHSVVGALVRAGKLTPDQVRRHPRRNEILQAVGIDRQIEPERQCWTLAARDVVLLCSDGLWEMLSEAAIAEVLDAPLPLPARAARLVDLANEAGGRDNVTVVLYEHP